MGPRDHDHDQRQGSGHEPDPVIARALGAIPVPERRPDFFDRLDEALDAVDAETVPAAAVTPTTPSTASSTFERGASVPTELTEPATDTNVLELGDRRREKGLRRYRLLAAAASVAVVIGAVAVVAGSGDPTTTVTPADRGAQSPPAGEPEPSAEAERLRQAFDAVMKWSAAVDENRAQQAWEGMGPGSQAYLTEQGGWDDMFAAMGEGSHAAWHRTELPQPEPFSVDSPSGSQADGDVGGLFGRSETGRVSVVNVPGDDRAAVVVLSAELELEGTAEHVTDAYPLVLDGAGQWRVEPFAFGPGETLARFVVPGTSERQLADMRPDATVVVAAPDGDVFVSFGYPSELHAMERRADGRWTHHAGPAFAFGRQDVLVVTRGDDWFTAHPARFFVAESEPVACESIGFTPDSEDMASEIRATATSCADAEELVRHVHSDMRHDFASGPRRFEALGYDCEVVTEEQELPVGHYSCIDGAARVTWDKT